MSSAGNISFKTFCDLCSNISQARREKKSEILRNFIESWRNGDQDVKNTNSSSKPSFYPILRILLPQLDRERGAYGVKENTLAKIYIRILCLPKNGTDATKLLEFRTPKNVGLQAGDFAEVAYWVLKSRCSKGEELSVDDVNFHLDAVAEKHAANNPRGVDSELTTLLRSTSAEEQKWLIRIILKDMKLGLGHNKILTDYHPDARDYYDSCNDLQKICNVLIDPKVRLHEVGIQMFSPFRPMLSEECDIRKIDNYLKRSVYFYIETKLDGERFQVHMKEGIFKYFSRNGYEYTSNFGNSPEEGTLTPRLARNIRSDVKCIILDGEMMCWNQDSNRFVTKGMNTDVKNLKEDSCYQPCFCAFDVLYLDGYVLTNQPLNYRLNVLDEVINWEQGVICSVERKKISKKEEVWDSLNDAIENREEGIVMKDFLSVYKPNIRKNGGWYKLKPEYADGLMDALDVLIIGGYYGSGRHSGNVSHFLLGVAGESVPGGNPKKFYSVARVGSGYSMSELSELQMKLVPYWKPVKLGEIPPRIEWTKEKPDVWIEPHESFILQVKASEIMPSDSFPTRYTLRFPRVENVRYDKSWTDCLTLQEFEEKRRAASGKLVKRTYDSNESNDDSPVKRKSPRKCETSLGVQFRPTNVEDVECQWDLLESKEICVFSGCDKFSKSQVERKIAEYGGTLVQNPGPNTYCVLAEEESNVRIINVIKCGTHDVVRTSWFVTQLNKETELLPDPTPEVLLGMSTSTRKRLSKTYDEFGDDYTKFATKESLQHPFRIIEKIGKPELSPSEMYDLDVELFSGPSPYSLFRNCVAYFDLYTTVGDKKSSLLRYLDIPLIDFKFRGGVHVDIITDFTTHVILSNRDLSRVEEFLKLNRRRVEKFHIVTEDWINSCLDSKQILNENRFIPDCVPSQSIGLLRAV